MIRALIFDCDGVLADTERDGHLPAFNATFRDQHLPVVWSDEDYRELVRIGGGKERMRTLFDDALFLKRTGISDDAGEQNALLKKWHAIKTRHYTCAVAQGLMPGRPGVARLARQADAAGWRLAVASTSAEESVRAVLTHVVGEKLAARFQVFAGDIVASKKPAPDIYLLALDRLGVIASEAVVVEDSSVGATAAAAAGIRTVVTVSTYTAEEEFPAASVVLSCLGEPEDPAEVLANASGIQTDGIVTVDTLEALLAT